ncbi:hypothetical protein HN011_001893, partial [Eciton burchellii]
QAFENIHHMLRNGGTMLVLILCHISYDILEVLMNDIRFSPYMQNMHKYISPYKNAVKAHKDLKCMLKNIGFKIYHSSCRDTVHYIKNREILLDSLFSPFGWFDKTPYDRRNEFKNIFMHGYLKDNINIKLTKNNEKQYLEIFEKIIIYTQKTK